MLFLIQKVMLQSHLKMYQSSIGKARNLANLLACDHLLNLSGKKLLQKSLTFQFLKTKDPQVNLSTCLQWRTNKISLTKMMKSKKAQFKKCLLKISEVMIKTQRKKKCK